VVLKRITRHHETGAVIPDELITKLLASRHHMDANYYLAQAVMALYDFRMHGQPTDAPVEPDQLAAMLRNLEREYRGLAVPDDALKAAGWSHMADYDAAYYGYLWSKVYAKDLFTRFSAEPMDADVGADYRRMLLEPGASAHEVELVRSFLRREPSDDAFLEALGIH
jgi:Zn-dependent oligopeptidase